MASPFTIINRSDKAADIQAIVGVIRQYQVERVIAGLPRSMNGSLGRQVEKVRAFVQELSEHIEVPIDFRDERLSTVAARRLMQASGGRKSGKKASDAIAAALILQSYLDEALNQ